MAENSKATPLWHGTGEGMETRDASCLIDASTDVKSLQPPYWHPLELTGGVVASVDMVRLKLTFPNGGYEWMMDHADRIGDRDATSTWSIAPKQGHYKTMWTYGIGDSSVSLGVGLFTGTGKLDTHKGYLELNPNKVAGHDMCDQLLYYIGSHVTGAEVKRYDLAYDIPADKNVCRVSKDRRTYSCTVSNGTTEYLGQKNRPGYVKVYDKAAESGLEGPLTRVELTCDGAWTADQIEAAWPVVHGWTSDGDEARALMKALVVSLGQQMEHGDEVESILAILDYRTREKVRAHLHSEVFELQHEAAEYAVSESRAWARRLSVKNR